MYGKKPLFYRFLYKNQKMRSSWEVLFAVWLDLSQIKWKYEPKTFSFDTFNYTPDFYLPEFDCWIEIKGWFRDNSKEKLMIFKQKYNFQLFSSKELKDFLGVSRYLLEKSKLTWLDNYRIKTTRTIKESR